MGGPMGGHHEPPPAAVFGSEHFTDEEAQRIQMLLERKLAPEEMATRSGGGKGQRENKTNGSAAVQTDQPRMACSGGAAC